MAEMHRWRQWRWVVAVIAGMLILAGGRGAVSAQSAPVPPTVTYRANIAPNLQFQLPVQGCAPAQSPDACSFAGTTGQGKAVHAFDFQLTNNTFNAGLRCEAHVSNVGWVPEVGEGQACGVIINSTRRVEAIKLRLVNAPVFSIQYRCNLQNIGWTAFVADGAQCGTTGQGRNLEALQVRIVVRPVNQNIATGQTVALRLSADEAGGQAVFNMVRDAPLVPAQQAWTQGLFATSISQPGAVWSNFNFTGSCITVPGGQTLRLPFIPRSAQVNVPCPGASTFDAQQRSEILFYSDVNQQGRRTSVFTHQIAGVNPDIQDARSFSIPKGRRVALYTQTDLSGACAPLIGTDPGTKGNIADLAGFPAGTRPRSLAVDLGCGESPDVPRVTLWSGLNFTGERFNVLRDIADLNAPGFAFGRKAQSLQFGGGLKAAALYSQPSFQGTCSTAVFINHADLSILAVGNAAVQSIQLGQTCTEALASLTASPVVTDLQFIDGTAATIACPVRTEKVPVNLNDGAGGDFLFMCVRYGNDATATSVLRDLIIMRGDSVVDTCNAFISGARHVVDRTGALFDLNRGVPPNGVSFDLAQQLPVQVPVFELAPCPRFVSSAAGIQPVRDIKLVVNPPGTFKATTNITVTVGNQTIDTGINPDSDHSADAVRNISKCPANLPGYKPAQTQITGRSPRLEDSAVELNLGKNGATEIYICVATAPPPPAVGVLALEQTDLIAAAGEPVNVTLNWTVPEGRVWRDLATLDLRIGDEEEAAVFARFDIATGTLAVFDGAGDFIGNVAPGTEGTLDTPLAGIDTGASRIAGSGPDGREVSLSLALRFKPETAGFVYRVDIIATDTTGAEQIETAAGTVTVPFTG